MTIKFPRIYCIFCSPDLAILNFILVDTNNTRSVGCPVGNEPENVIRKWRNVSTECSRTLEFEGMFEKVL